AKEGESAYAQGNYHDALHLFDKAVAFDPLVSRYRDLRGKARLQTGDSGGALTDFDGALSLTGQRDPEAHYMRASWSFAAGNARAALAELDLALEVDGRRGEAWGARAQVHGVLGDLDAARSDMERAAQVFRETGNKIALSGIEDLLAKSVAGTAPKAPD